MPLGYYAVVIKKVNMSLTLAIDCEVENVAVSYGFILRNENIVTLLFSEKRTSYVKYNNEICRLF